MWGHKNVCSAGSHRRSSLRLATFLAALVPRRLEPGSFFHDFLFIYFCSTVTTRERESARTHAQVHTACVRRIAVERRKQEGKCRLTKGGGRPTVASRPFSSSPIHGDSDAGRARGERRRPVARVGPGLRSPVSPPGGLGGGGRTTARG